MGSIPIGISASRGAAILGQSKYSEPVDAWLKICESITPGFCEANFYPKPEFVDNAATRWGNALEQYIIEFAELEYKKETNKVTAMTDMERLYTHPEYDYITCHIDGAYAGLNILHEGKTANERTYRNDWGEPGTDQIPRGYMVQVQHQMMLTGADRCIVSVLVLPKMQDELPDPDELTESEIRTIATGLYSMGYFHQYPVEANKELQDLMVEKYVRFWNGHVLTKRPPRPRSLDWIKKLIPEPHGTIIANEQVQRWSTELSSLNRELKTGEARKKELREFIFNYMRDEMERENFVIDKETKKKMILMAPNGRKMHSYNGKQFR